MERSVGFCVDSRHGHHKIGCWMWAFLLQAGRAYRDLSGSIRLGRLGLLPGLAALTNGVLAVALVHEKALRARHEENAGKSAIEARLAKAEALAFRQALLRQPLSPDFLSGVDVLTGEPLVLSAVQDGLYYLVDPTCPLTLANVPALNQLAALQVQVIGISYSDPTRLLKYVRDSGIKFLVVGQPLGRLPSFFPGDLAPAAIFISGGRPRFISVGVIPTEWVDYVRQDLGGEQGMRRF